MNKRITGLLAVAVWAGCASPEGTGLAETGFGTGAEVVFDVYAKPLPNIPLPNDFATRFDATSPTKRRVNASMLAATRWERATREELDNLDGWGTYQSISVAFSKPLDLHNIIRRHQGDDYDPRDDVAYLVDITPDSPDFCERVPLDLGEGNFPIVLERPGYFDNDREGNQLLFDDREEDLNRNGKLDLGEDLDMDGVLDHPNTLFPGDSTFKVLPFYERETNTLLMKPVMPLRERQTYAVVLTKRLTDEDGRPVRSPYRYVNHASQSKALEPLKACLPKLRLGVEDIAFTWSYTTQSVTSDYVAVRDGFYGLGPMAWLSQEYPAEISKILTLRDAVPGSQVNVRIVSGDQFRATAVELLKQLGGSGDTLTPALQEVAEHHKFIDYHVVFQFVSPQFFPREDAEGNPLPLYKQLMKVNAETGEAYHRPETVTVWLTVPKNRGNKPAPAVILGHGYTGNKLDPLFYGGFFARYGLASIGMENVSHGIGLGETDMTLARGLLAGKGLGNMFDAIAGQDRAFDQNRDGVKDSAADFWTSYILHTREVVKQSALDYMLLIRIMRAWDGQKTWGYDANRDGQDDLAGDFNGDGVIDVGGGGSINITGGSLGGIMSAMMSGLEPQIDVAIPVSGGAGLPDIGVRSIQGGVREAVNLRMLGPVFTTVRSAMGQLEAFQILPNLNGLGRVKLGPVEATLNEGDTVVLFNETSGEHRCARVGANGIVRAAVSSDEGDEWRAAAYRGALPPLERAGCDPAGAEPYWTMDTFLIDAKFQGLEHKAGDSLIALGDGFGLRRQSPEIRRFLGLAQMAIERGDPVNFLPFTERNRILRYGTGEEVSTRMVVVNTIGDMNVPVATGVSIARAAGMIDLFSADARYGKTANRVLIDTGVIEAVERVGTYQNSAGQNVLMDVDHFSALSGSGTQDGFDAPRLSPPLRLVKKNDRVGGVTGVIFPMVVPTGRHGFDTPDPSLPFNLGSVMLNMLGRYMQTGGEELPMEACLESSSCSWVAPIPAD